MSFLDKLKEQAGIAAGAVGSVTRTAAKQTKTLAAIARIKLSITSEEEKIKKAYTELGRLFYRDHAAHAEISLREYLPWCDKVSDAKAEIEKLNRELERLHAEAQSQEAMTEPVIEMDFAAEDAESAEEEDPAVAIHVKISNAPASGAAPEADAVPGDQPVVNTLYVDISNPEE